jgi:membrane-bound inhibitor of C-type lysozyme
MKKINWKVLLTIFCLLFLGFYSGYKYKEVLIKQNEEASKIDFHVCIDGKTIRAVYYDNFNSVNILLSDKRVFDLQHMLSVDGMRFANTDDSIVFWTKGGNGRFEEKGEITYSECILGNDPPSTE